MFELRHVQELQGKGGAFLLSREGPLIRFKDTDRILIISPLLLVVLGVVMVYSTSYVVAMKRFGDEYFFVKKHLTYALAGVVMMIVASRIPDELYREMAYPILIAAAL